MVNDDRDPKARSDPSNRGPGQGDNAEQFWSRYAEAGRESVRARQGDEGDHQDGDHRCLDWCPICRGVERLEDSIPPELKEQFRVVQRDALLLARAAIDAHLARYAEAPDQGRRRGPDDPGIEDIPIE